jgi:hypothetical protein
MIIAALLLSVAACGRPAEEPESNWATFTIVHTCQNGKQIFRDRADQGLMIWNGHLWIGLDQDATIEGVCGEAIAPSDAGLDPSAITG